MRLEVLFSILLVLNTADYYLTLYNVNNGAKEANILLQSIIQNSFAFMFVKIVLVTATLLILLKLLQKILSKMNIIEKIKVIKTAKVVGYIVMAVYIVTIVNNVVVASAEEIYINKSDYINKSITTTTTISKPSASKTTGSGYIKIDSIYLDFNNYRNVESVYTYVYTAYYRSGYYGTGIMYCWGLYENDSSIRRQINASHTFFSEDYYIYDGDVYVGKIRLSVYALPDVGTGRYAIVIQFLEIVDSASGAKWFTLQSVNNKYLEWRWYGSTGSESRRNYYAKENKPFILGDGGSRRLPWYEDAKLYNKVSIYLHYDYAYHYTGSIESGTLTVSKYSGFTKWVIEYGSLMGNFTGTWEESNFNCDDFTVNLAGYIKTAKVYYDTEHYVQIDFPVPCPTVTLIFKDVSNNLYLDNVIVNYTILGPLGFEVANDEKIFDSFDEIQVKYGSSLLINKIKKENYTDKGTIEGFMYGIMDITTNYILTIEMYPVSLAPIENASRVLIFFKNAETGYLIDGVALHGEVYYNGQIYAEIDGIYNAMYSITVPNGSIIYIKSAKASGFQSELEKTSKYLWFEVKNETVEKTIWFYPVEGTLNATVKFHYIDAKTGYYINNANLTIKYNDQIIYQENGTSYWSEVQLEKGKTYAWIVEKEGYYEQSGTITVTESKHDVYVYLIPIETPTDPTNNTIVSFFVINVENVPIQSAVVTLNGQSRVTNSNGYCYFEVAKNNTYSWMVSAHGYYGKSGIVSVGTEPALVKVVLDAIVAPTTTSPEGGTGGGGTGGFTPPSSSTLEEGINALYTNAGTLINLAILVTILNFLYMMMPRRRR